MTLWLFCLLARLIRLAFAVAMVAAVGSGLAWLAARPAVPDTFYIWDHAPSTRPGNLLRSAPFTRAVPAGGQGWRILYTTTRWDGTPAVASAIVLRPTGGGEAPRPVIAWAHGTTGIDPGCAPSVLVDPFANVPAVDALLREGWLYVATDYAGLGTAGGHAYLVGDDAARSVLDSIRAARELEGVAADNRVVVWGHSQGGNSALWTGQRAAAYAPDVNIVGIAALAPATDLKALVSASRGSMFGKIVSSYLIEAYGAAYSEVAADGYVRDDARRLVRDMAGRCVGGWETLVSAAGAWLLPEDGIFARDPAEGPLGQRLEENTPLEPIAAPVLIAQGEIDDLVLPDVQRGYVDNRCAAGQVIDYRNYPGLDHISLVAPDSPLGPELIAWSRASFEGQAAMAACQR